MVGLQRNNISSTLYKVKPKKRLGQHFLKDLNVAKKITDSLSPGTVNLIEIGPGTGVLTQFLSDAYFPGLYLIEIDDESVEFLKKQFPILAERIIHTDFLSCDLKRLFSGDISIIGNFPYNISSQILFKVLECRSQVKEVVGMFQKEVAERICSPAGSKKYGILSVLLQSYYDIEYLFTVSEKTFYPEPKVKSAVIRLKRNKTVRLDCDEAFFIQLVKTAFNQRRKTLRNALRKFEFRDQVKGSDIFDKRAEQLGVNDFVFLTKQIKTSL